MDSELTYCNVGCQKKRNIRDNLFVINDVTNSSKKGTDNPWDICIYDVQKRFDNLWKFECLNDLYESGFTNNNLCLLYNASKNCNEVCKWNL